MDGLPCTSKRKKKASNYAISLSVQSGMYPEFKGIEGPSPIVDPSMSPLELVRLLWPNTLCELIAQETKQYAIVDRKLKNWSDVTAEELWAFLGIIVIMGIHHLPEIDNYWSSDRFLGVEAVQKCMSRNRFWSIWSNIHLVDNSSVEKTHGQSFRLKPLVDVFTHTFQEHYSPGQELSLDESMVKYKGRGRGKVKMPKKHTREGFKVWSCSSAKTGYLCTFQIYDGMPVDPVTGKKVHERGLVKRVVHDLLASFTGLNHVVYMDNFYTSGELAEELAKDEIYTVGTIKSDAKGFPAQLKNLTLSRGEYVSFKSGDIVYYAFHDRKVVRFLSNVFPETMPNQVPRVQPDGTFRYQAVPPFCLHTSTWVVWTLPNSFVKRMVLIENPSGLGFACFIVSSIWQLLMLSFCIKAATRRRGLSPSDQLIFDLSLHTNFLILVR